MVWMRVDLPRYEALGVPFHPVTRASARSLVLEAMAQDDLTFVVTLGTEMVMFAQHDEAFRAIVGRADLVVPDGIGLVFASRLAGLQAPERVTGVDMLADLISGAREQDSFFFYGSAPGVAAKAVENLKANVGEFRCAGVLDGYIKDEAMIVDTICAARPTALFVALGFPRQEGFLDRHRKRFEDAGVRVCIGVGGSFDAYAGTVERAPAWVQRIHFEWLYRLWKQPSRWRRMLVLPQFAGIVLRAPKRAVKVIS
jgi:N-acetylglucosaminyldiphosphoundecaprenol N-acetyl-beta-D-mannosaminyltransferase